MVRWVIVLITYGGPIELILVSAVHHDWINKGHGMCYPVYGMVHIKNPLLLTENVLYHMLMQYNIVK